jgi:hypothetical protein
MEVVFEYHIHCSRLQLACLVPVITQVSHSASTTYFWSLHIPRYTSFLLNSLWAEFSLLVPIGDIYKDKFKEEGYLFICSEWRHCLMVLPYMLRHTFRISELLMVSA